MTSEVAVRELEAAHIGGEQLGGVSTNVFLDVAANKFQGAARGLRQVRAKSGGGILPLQRNMCHVMDLEMRLEAVYFAFFVVVFVSA